MTYIATCRLLLGALRAMGAPFATFTALLAAALAFFAAIGLEFLGAPKQSIIMPSSTANYNSVYFIQHDELIMYFIKHVRWVIHASGGVW